MKDLLIIGGSVAASSAAVYAARRKLDVAMVSADTGGEVATSGEIENWPGIIHTTGTELSKQFAAHVKNYEVPWDDGFKVASIAKTTTGFKVVAQAGEQEKVYESRTILVATGVHPRELGVAGEQEFRGKGITYCTVCDGPLFGGKTVATIGGGNSALESALMMAGIAKHVYLINKNEALKGDAILIEKIKAHTNVTEIANAQTESFSGETFLKGLSYKDMKTGELKTLEVEGAFVHIGMVPNSEIVPSDVVKNKFGEIEVNALCETSVPGLFAAGDVTNVPYKQIGIAAGQGICAALTAVSYINKLPH